MLRLLFSGEKTLSLGAAAVGSVCVGGAGGGGIKGELMLIHFLPEYFGQCKFNGANHPLLPLNCQLAYPSDSYR